MPHIVGDAFLELELGGCALWLVVQELLGLTLLSEGLVGPLAEDLLWWSDAVLFAWMVAMMGTLQGCDPAVPRLLDVDEMLEAVARS